MRGGSRATFLALRDHGKVFVADLPRLSDGQLCNVVREAREVLESLNRRIEELQQQINLSQLEQETIIRASTKRDVTERFIRAVDDEQEQRRSNPALKAAAGESLSRTFLELARHRLPGATSDSLLQEAVCILELETGLKLDPDAAISGDEAEVSNAGSEQASSDLPPSGSVKVEPLEGDNQSGPGAGPTLAARPRHRAISTWCATPPARTAIANPSPWCRAPIPPRRPWPDPASPELRQPGVQLTRSPAGPGLQPTEPLSGSGRGCWACADYWKPAGQAPAARTG
jgi:hypothetical protein